MATKRTSLEKPFKVSGSSQLGIEMELKYVVGGLLAVSGGVLALNGFINANQEYINLGIAGMFLSAIVLIIKSSKYVKKESLDIILKSQKEVFNNLLNNLKLEGNAIYIPPYENLPSGGIFIPLHENFDIDLARFDEGTLFLTDVPNEKAMGLLMASLGKELLKKYEEHLEASVSSVPDVESAASSVLKTLGLANRVYIEENGEDLRVIVDPEFSCEPNGCEKLPCPICASIFLGLAKATNQLISIQNFQKKEHGIEITAKKLGGVREWM